jgi:hypothetical protein
MEQELTRSSRLLVRVTAILLVLGIGPPAIDFFFSPIFRHLQFMSQVISLPLSLWGFLDYALGKALCVAIAACVLAVLIKPGIQWWIKLVLLASALLTVPLVLHWVERLSHEW